MARWTAFPHAEAAYRYDAAALRMHWAQLHAGDAEPWPDDRDVLNAWALFHAGEFEAATVAGLATGGHGITVANRAQLVYANYLEPSEKARQDLFMQAAERAEARLVVDPTDGAAHYAMAYALGSHGQGTRIAKALAQGLGVKVKSGLESAIRFRPAHADAHVALGVFHAEVIHKVGSLLGRTQGASREAGLAMFKAALRLNPSSAISRVHCANSLVMLDGDKALNDATRLYEEAAASAPMDALERLGAEMAKTVLGG